MTHEVFDERRDIIELANWNGRSSISHSHYSLLRTVEDAWGLGCLNRTCAANDLREFFGP